MIGSKKLLVNILARAGSTSVKDKNIADSSGKMNISVAVGQVVAERAKEKGIGLVVFDRGGYKFHGRVKAVTEGAREEGLIF